MGCGTGLPGATEGDGGVTDFIRLVKTCDACPEQYDAFVGEVQVGYLRLRHGRFTVQCPDSTGQLWLESYPEGDGVFQYAEREYWLNKAKEVIVRYVRAQAPKTGLYERKNDAR